MNKNERLGLVILKTEINRCKLHTQKCLDYMGVVSQLQHDESKNIAYQSQQSQLDCHMEELNHSFEQLEMVIESEWQRNQHKIKKDLLLLTKQKCGKV